MKLITSPARCIVIALTLAFALQADAEVLQRVSARNSSIQPPSGGDGDSGAPILSPDGRFVLFSSSAADVALMGSNAIPSQFPARLNVYLRDRIAGTNRLVSFNAAATAGGNRDSVPAALSANSQNVLFESDASDLVADDINNATDIFIRNFATETTSIVSVDKDGNSANGRSYGAVMTPDARYVAFVSTATDLVLHDTNGIPDVFVRDLQSGQTTLVSVGAKDVGTTIPVSASESPDITPDGRYVAFYSTATNLVPDAMDKGGIYVRDMVSSETFWASTNARSFVEATLGASAAPNTVAFNHEISDDGQFVAFEAGSRSAYQGLILRINRATAATDLVATNAAVAVASGRFENVRNLEMTPDGRFIAYVMTTNIPGGSARCIAVWDANTGLTTVASQDLNGAVQVHSVSDWPILDPTGRYVAFVSDATNLTPNPWTGGFNLYVRDLETETTTLVNETFVNGGPNGTASPISGAMAPSMTVDGQQFAFVFPDGTLVPNDRNRSYDVAVRDLNVAAVELVSAKAPSLTSVSSIGYAQLYDRSVSWDGRYVVFASDAEDLNETDSNGYRDAFIRDLLTGTSTLVSTATNGLVANAPSIPGGISDDGRYVAFTSTANNLAAGDANGVQDVFVRDQLLGTNILVSRSYLAPVSGNGPSSSPILSTNGQVILFQSQANNLTQPPGTGLFWRNLSLSTNRLVGGIGANALEGTMTPDGKLVAYLTSVNTIRVWDSEKGSNTYTSPTSATAPFAISPDGQWLVYSANKILVGVNLEVGTNFAIWSHQMNLQRPGLQFDAEGRYLTYSASSADVFTNSQIYLSDFETGTNKLISRAFASSEPASGRSDSPVISADGRYVAYVSSATNIIPGDHNGLPNIFLYDRLNDSTLLVTVNLAGTGAANNRSLKPMFSGDGATLVFQSAASDIIPGESNHRGDIFALRLASAAITDTDNDQLDDDWELLHFKTMARNGTEDFDQDGANDLFEFRTGTNPQNAASFFRGELMFSGDPAQMPLILWPAAPGKSYRVQFKDALDDSAWQDLSGNISILGQTGYATDPAPDASHRFYRIVLNEPSIP